MSFKDLNIDKSNISKGKNNIVNSLINPALREAVSYKRSVGFFSSSVFDLIVDSLSNFVKNKGKIQLIVSPNLSKEDIDAIKNGYNKREIINNIVEKDFDEEIKKFNDKNLEILYELVACNVLDIKIVSVKEGTGIYHDKLGILEDKEGNQIVFFGSPNSSFSGYEANYERIRTLTSWNVNDNSVKDEIDEFDNIWNGKNLYLDTYSFNNALKDKIIIEKENRKDDKKQSNPIKLYNYQEEAIEAWIKNGYNGFYVMATGTGKTWTAIYSAKKLIEKHPCLIVIAAPYKHLIKQWAEDLEKVFKNANIVLISSENSKWELQVKRCIIDQTYNNEKQNIFITTIKSFYSEKFNNALSKSTQDKLLIVDEAHRFTKRDPSLHNIYKYMLGLSATPLNGKFNDSGYELLDFFGGQVYNLPIEKALQMNFLVPYYYYPIFVYANDEEEKEFNSYSAKMASCYKNNVLVDYDNFVKYSRARLKVIAMAKEKNDNIQDLISQIKDKDHFIVYCGDGKYDEGNDQIIRHINYVRDNIAALGYKSNPFTANEDMKRRMELVDMFNNQEIDALAAIKCLDEGINIPSIKSALILSSNDDYREFVQRRGRILRKYKDPNTNIEKKFANIYDVIVLPNYTQKMALIELRRYYEYAKLAINNDECLEKLEDLLLRYDLKLDDIEFYIEGDKEDDLDE